MTSKFMQTINRIQSANFKQCKRKLISEPKIPQKAPKKQFQLDNSL